MSEFTLSPPSAILFLAIGVVLVGTVSVLLKKGDPTRKVIAMAIILVVAAALVIVAYRPITVTVDREGIRTSGLNPVELSWDEITTAGLQQDLGSSGYRPTVRTRGTALGDYRTGRFLLSNGDKARLFMARQDAAVVLETNGLTYLLAPQDLEGLAAAIDQYRTTER